MSSTSKEFLKSFRNESAQFFVYVASLISSLAINNIVQEELSSKPLGLRVAITLSIIIISLLLVTLVSFWMKPSKMSHVNDTKTPRE